MDAGRLLTVVLLLAALGALLPSMWGERPGGMHVSGDRADLLPRGDAPSAEAARLGIVVLSGWTKLRHIPRGRELCGAACRTVPGPRLVRIVELRPSGARKVVLLRLGEGVGVEPAGPEAVPCARAAIAAEAARLLGAAPPCGGEAITRWRLPLGLGFVTAR